METKKTTLQQLYQTRYVKILPYFKEKRAQQSTMLILTIVALSAFIIFAINPTLSTITELQKQLTDSKFVDQRLDQKIQNLTTLQQKYADIESQLPPVYNAIPQKADAPTLMGQLYAIGKSENVTVDRLQTFTVELLEPKKIKSPYVVYAFSVEMHGTYDNISQFLQTITKFQRIVTIDAISLAKGTGKDTDLHVIVKGKAYFKT